MIDKKVFWVFLFQIFKILNSLITVIILPQYLTLGEQGIWFLMLSFGALILLLVSSQSNIVLIFGAHEFKKLRYHNFELIGAIKDKEQLFAYIRYSGKLFLQMLLLLSIGTLIVFSLYIHETDTLHLIGIFFVYLVGLYFYAFNFSLLTYFESFNQIAYAYKYKVFLTALWMGLTLLFLYKKYALQSLAFATFDAMFFIFCILVYLHKKNILLVYKTLKRFSVHKKKVFLTYFKKNSFSMLSGFLLFQVYTPLVYYFDGKLYSGKVGFSVSIMTALFAVSMSILHSKLPHVTHLISQKNYKQAYDVYFRASKKTLIIYISCLFIGMYVLFKTKFFTLYQSRVVDLTSFSVLAFSWFLQHITYFLVTFVRLFKRELFVLPTIVSSFYILFSTIVILKYSTPEFIFFGLLSSYLFGLPWVYVRYRNFLKGRITV